MGYKLGQQIIDRIRRKESAIKSTYQINQEKYNLGVYTYMSPNCVIAHKDTKIGKFCSIAGNVVIGPGQHPTNFLSTHPFQYLTNIDEFKELKVKEGNLNSFNSYKPCYIGNDVWIGCNSVIMDGVKIADGAIIGANSVITKDVPPYAIVVGANRIVKYRFEQNVIDELLKLKWWDLEDEQIANLPFSDINECIKILKTIKK